MNYHLLYGCGIFLCLVAYGCQVYENRVLKKKLDEAYSALMLVMAHTALLEKNK